LLEKAEAEGRSDNRWTLVQCKCKPHKMGVYPDTNGDHDHVNDDRESHRLTKMNRRVKWNDATVITIKESVHDFNAIVIRLTESVHEMESNGNRGAKRERTMITSKLNGWNGKLMSSLYFI
jgi:hypothetical protein